MTKIQKANAESIQRAVDCINSGGIVVLPTNTNYSVACDPFNINAVQQIFQVKRRTKFGPLTLFLSAAEEIPKYTLPTPGFSIELARNLWPGEVSFVLYKQSIISDAVTCGAKTVAVGCHGHPVLQRVISALGQPICVSSANISGQGDIHVNLDKAIADLLSSVDMILDDGYTKAEHTSSDFKSNTIIDFTFQPPFLVRKGLLPIESILKNIPDLVGDTERYRVVLMERIQNMVLHQTQ